MVNEKSSSNLCPRMNLNPGQETIYMGDESAQKAEIMTPEVMSYAVCPHSMQAGVAKDYFCPASCCRISIEDNLKVFFEPVPHLKDTSLKFTAVLWGYYTYTPISSILIFLKFSLFLRSSCRHLVYVLNQSCPVFFCNFSTS